jgi:hypothetical protein
MKQEQHKVQAEIMQAYREIFLHTPQGQIIFKDMLKASNLYAMTGVRSDSEVQHLEGGRDMVRRIITILALDDEQITLIATGQEGIVQNE